MLLHDTAASFRSVFFTPFSAIVEVLAAFTNKAIDLASEGATLIIETDLVALEVSIMAALVWLTGNDFPSYSKLLSVSAAIANVSALRFLSRDIEQSRL